MFYKRPVRSLGRLRGRLSSWPFLPAGAKEGFLERLLGEVERSCGIVKRVTRLFGSARARRLIRESKSLQLRAITRLDETGLGRCSQ